MALPGDYRRAHLIARDAAGVLHVSFETADGAAAVEVRAEPASDLGSGFLFADVDQASAFFQKGSVGCSATRGCDRFDGMELRTEAWVGSGGTSMTPDRLGGGVAGSSGDYR
ncbi:MAG: hypothetical protein M3137_06075 [Actinomycetota bacterium]|nr:hypothetical protein [Actinomycetota bacterium]